MSIILIGFHLSFRLRRTDLQALGHKSSSSCLRVRFLFARRKRSVIEQCRRLGWCWSAVNKRIEVPVIIAIRISFGDFEWSLYPCMYALSNVIAAANIFPPTLWNPRRSRYWRKRQQIPISPPANTLGYRRFSQLTNFRFPGRPCAASREVEFENLAASSQKLAEHARSCAVFVIYWSLALADKNCSRSFNEQKTLALPFTVREFVLKWSCLTWPNSCQRQMFDNIDNHGRT